MIHIHDPLDKIIEKRFVDWLQLKQINFRVFIFDFSSKHNEENARDMNSTRVFHDEVHDIWRRHV